MSEKFEWYKPNTPKKEKEELRDMATAPYTNKDSKEITSNLLGGEHNLESEEDIETLLDSLETFGNKIEFTEELYQRFERQKEELSKLNETIQQEITELEKTSDNELERENQKKREHWKKLLKAHKILKETINQLKQEIDEEIDN